MTTTLITGATQGLGREAARRLLGAGHTVYLTGRDRRAGTAAAEELGARFLPLDVTDDESVEAAAAAVRQEVGHLDVLVNNAGISGGRTPVEQVTADDVQRVLDTNVLGVVRVTHAFLPLLSASQHPVIVNVASGLGSPRLNTDPTNIAYRFPTLAYSASKAAVLLLTIKYALGLPGIKVNAVDPGYTATNLNGYAGTQSLQEGTDAIVAMATVGADGPTATFWDRDGQLAW